MDINPLLPNDLSKITQSEVEGQEGNAQARPDLDDDEACFTNLMSSAPDAQDSGSSGTVVVNANPDDPKLYSGSAEQAQGSANVQSEYVVIPDGFMYGEPQHTLGGG